MKRQKAKYNANKVAKWFLAYNRKVMIEGDSEYISNLKLQKLLYYAQGTYYALTNNLLFPEEIVAWRHGPVVESIYHKYKHSKSEGIIFEETFDFSDIDSETHNILEEVYNTFGQYSAWKLRNMTHNESPWKNTQLNHALDVDDIKNYFLKEFIAP